LDQAYLPMTAPACRTRYGGRSRTRRSRPVAFGPALGNVALHARTRDQIPRAFSGGATDAGAPLSAKRNSCPPALGLLEVVGDSGSRRPAWRSASKLGAPAGFEILVCL